MTDELTKRCSHCKEQVPQSNFTKNRNSKDGLGSRCLPCNRLMAKKHYDQNSDKIKEYHRNYRVENKDRLKEYRASKRSYDLEKNYGITQEDYEVLLEKQNGVCAICKQNRPYKGEFMCVDHDHTTGAVRGILCSNCNKAIGLLQDSPDLLKSAIEYLIGRTI